MLPTIPLQMRRFARGSCPYDIRLLKDTLREEYALWHGTAGQLEELDKNAIVSRRVTAYGAEALVKRELVPAGSTLTPVSIEELFVLMVKGENVR